MSAMTLAASSPRSAALLVPLIGAAFVLRDRGPLVRAVTVALIPVALIVAVATGSRGPLLALLVVGLLGLSRYLSRPRSVDWRLVGGAAGLAVATLVVASVVAPELPGSSLQRFTDFGDFVQGAFASCGFGDDRSGQFSRPIYLRCGRG